MPLFKCDFCHHEWESSKDYLINKCDWCNNNGHIIEKETELEKFIKKIYENENFSKFLDFSDKS